MRLKIANHVTWKNLNAGVVLLDLNTSNYYTLNETASFICQKIIDGKSEHEILDSMLDEFDCDKEVCNLDIQQQIQYLKSEKLITDA